ncbi:CBS domain-containing protein [Jidongwangia harbinensis]|uniref:CBS domain-containing protein n=1 Tax=Jidongwangia harbinensis TaxID=2878561 RepID=UPI001CD9EEE0|nr:CBS domain-containing protein [Jidongwangia harbinensis]MCA2218904.1 CBS domain-containing protein [Jidongwangia harbinensis]
MQQRTVRDVMPADVITVDHETPPADVAKTMTPTYDVSALAVVDDDDSVLGIITRADVLTGLQVRAPDRSSCAPSRRQRRCPTWTAQSAGQMMSAPP